MVCPDFTTGNIRLDFYSYFYQKTTFRSNYLDKLLDMGTFETVVE